MEYKTFSFARNEGPKSTSYPQAREFDFKNMKMYEVKDHLYFGYDIKDVIPFIQNHKDLKWTYDEPDDYAYSKYCTGLDGWRAATPKELEEIAEHFETVKAREIKAEEEAKRREEQVVKNMVKALKAKGYQVAKK